MSLLTVEEVARRLKVASQTVRRYIKNGELHASKAGRFWRIDEQQLEAYLSRTIPTAQPNE